MAVACGEDNHNALRYRIDHFRLESGEARWQDGKLAAGLLISESEAHADRDDVRLLLECRLKPFQHARAALRIVVIIDLDADERCSRCNRKDVGRLARAMPVEIRLVVECMGCKSDG